MRAAIPIVIVLAVIGFRLAGGGTLLSDTVDIPADGAYVVSVELRSGKTVSIEASEADGKPFSCYWVNESTHNTIQTQNTAKILQAMSAIESNMLSRQQSSVDTSVSLPGGKVFIYFEDMDGNTPLKLTFKVK